MTRARVVAVALVVLVLAALVFLFIRLRTDGDRDPRRADARSARGVAVAVARLQPLGESRLAGTVSLVEAGTGVGVRYRLRNLPAGEYAFRLHELGDCSAVDGTSTGRSRERLGEVVGTGLGRLEGELSAARTPLGGFLDRSILVLAGDGRPLACGVVKTRW